MYSCSIFRGLTCVCQEGFIRVEKIKEDPMLKLYSGLFLFFTGKIYVGLICERILKLKYLIKCTLNNCGTICWDMWKNGDADI